MSDMDNTQARRPRRWRPQPDEQDGPSPRARARAAGCLPVAAVGQHDSHGAAPPRIETENLDKTDRELFVSLLRGPSASADELRGCFEPLLSRPLAELSPIEHAILLLGTLELRHNIDTPYRVVINEAIELAKGYGGTDGHKFVNGVLDKLAARLRPEEVAAARAARG